MLVGKRSMSICLFIILSGCENHSNSQKQIVNRREKNVLLDYNIDFTSERKSFLLSFFFKTFIIKVMFLCVYVVSITARINME